jgi:hypothetical protein
MVAEHCNGTEDDAVFKSRFAWWPHCVVIAGCKQARFYCHATTSSAGPLRLCRSLQGNRDLFYAVMVIVLPPSLVEEGIFFTFL